MTTPYAFVIELPLPLPGAVDALRAALAGDMAGHLVNAGTPASSPCPAD